MKKIIAMILGATVAASIVFALDGPPTEKTEKLPRSHVSAVNGTNMTFAVLLGGTNELTVRYTSKTKFYLNRMPAVSKDLEVGDHVSGTMQRGTNAAPVMVKVHIEKLAAK